jgi:hypothetical protein
MEDDLMTWPAPISGDASIRNTYLIEDKGMLKVREFTY